MLKSYFLLSVKLWTSNCKSWYASWLS